MAIGEFEELKYKSYGLYQKLHKKHSKAIVFRHGHIAITNYKMGDNFEFEKSLSIWDKMSFKYHLVGGYYVKELKEFRINRAYDHRMLQRFFPNYPMLVDNVSYPADKIDVELYAEPRSDFQRVGMTFMACKGIYEKNSKYTQQMITLPTGEGKSYLGSSTAAFLNARTVVIVPFSKLLKQWRETFTNFTSITDDEIMIVQGSKECQKIIDGKCKKIKVFIFMVDTIYSFQEREGDLAVIDMLRATKAYTKIVDEVHKDMKTLSMIEALSNFKMNYYLSASPGRTETKENWIFNTIFREMPKFGSDFRMDDEKHINVMVKKYLFTPTSKQINRMVNPKVGLNTRSYEKELITSPPEQRESFNSSLRVMLNWSKGILIKGNKILILAQTVAFIEYIQAIAEEIFPGKTALYHGSLKPAEKEEALKSTVIIATSGSLGTGADIKGLQHCYNCATYAGKIDAIQISGRLRKLPDDKVQTIYIELLNAGWLKTMRQYEKRKPHLLKISKTGKIIVIN